MSYKLNKRRLQKIYNWLKKLPGGLDFFRFCFNKAQGLILRLIKSTRVPCPSSIMLEVTNHCNLGCVTCPREYAFGQATDRGNMDPERMEKVIDEEGPYIDSIGLTGLGEALLYKKLEDGLRYI